MINMHQSVRLIVLRFVFEGPTTGAQHIVEDEFHPDEEENDLGGLFTSGIAGLQKHISGHQVRSNNEDKFETLTHKQLREGATGATTPGAFSPMDIPWSHGETFLTRRVVYHGHHLDLGNLKILK